MILRGCGCSHSCMCPIGRQFAFIRIKRKSIEIGANIINENRELLDYERIRVETSQEDYSPILKEIAQAYANLGG